MTSNIAPPTKYELLDLYTRWAKYYDNETVIVPRPRRNAIPLGLELEETESSVDGKVDPTSHNFCDLTRRSAAAQSSEMHYENHEGYVCANESSIVYAQKGM